MRALVFLLIAVFFQCISCNQYSDTENIEPQFEFITIKKESIQIISQTYDFFGKDIHLKFNDTSRVALVKTSNPSKTDTFYIHLFGYMLVSQQTFIRIYEDQSRKNLGFTGGEGYNTYALGPGETENFIVGYSNPIEINADEIEFSFPYSKADTLRDEATKYVKVIEAVEKDYMNKH